MLKLLIYSHSFAPQIGGVETIAMALARGLAESADPKQIHVTVATPSPRRTFDDASLPFTVVREPNLVKLVRLFREADIVQLAGPALLPMFLAWVLRKPWELEHHGFQTICPNGQLVQQPGTVPCPGHFMARRHEECLRCYAEGGRIVTARIWLQTFVRRWLAQKASLNVVPTSWLATQLRLPRVVTIHHGLRLQREPVLVDKHLRPPTFFFLGRIVSAKGVQVLLDAAGCLRDEGVQFRLRIAGDGPDRGALVSKASALGLTQLVSFIGSVSDKVAGCEMEGATAIIVPSLGGEVFGLVAAESMLRQCPVVFSDLGALREVVGDTGLSFAVGDARGLAACLSLFARSPERAAELGRRARTRALAEFTESLMLERHRDALYSVAAGERFY